MDKIKQIGFKAGEKPKRPVIQADTSASKSYASIAYGISEGEIVGLVDGAKSILLDGTPVMSSSGDINIPDVTIQERKGTNDQTHLEGFPAVVNEKQYNNIEMLFSTPFVHYINDTNLDAVGIRFTFGALQRTNPDSGDVSGITIKYAIDVQVDGQGYQELLRTSIVGKYSAGYQRYHRVELPPAEEGWEVRIRRLTPNSTSTYIADKMYLDAVAEILDVKMRYPNTALIGLKFDSERFSNIPKVDFRMRGKIIRVPANYDPVTRTYAQAGEGTTNGIWNGQFKMAYTTNPAWIFYDLVLNKRYGLGNRIDPSMLDKWSLYSIAQYCDVMVPDGEGGLEPRFTCNVYINNRFEAYDCLMQLAGVFRGIMYWSGTAIIAGCDRPQDPVFTYTRANIIGEFNYSGTRTRDRHSVVMVSFDDPKNNYKTDKEVVSDRKAISEIGVRTKDLAAFACTSRGQAQRAGKWALFKEQLETRIVTFALGMDGYIAPVGRVIEIADPLLAGRAVGGRIAAVSADKKTITLDRDTEVKVGDRLVLNNEEGEQESRQVASVTGRNVTVTVAFDSPAVQHVWAVDSDDLQLMRFTVISVTENRSQDSINFTVTALQHEPALHEVADYSAYIERNNYSVIDITTQKAPAEVLISSNNRINQGIDITDLVISWKQAENAVKYHVQWRRDDGNWIQMPLQYGNQVTIENVYHGVYEARVVAINAADVNSLPTSSLPTTINSKFAAPAALASLSATGILLGVELNWKFPLYGAQNAAYVEIYWALNTDKSDEQLLGSYAYPTTGTTLNGLAPHLTLYFRGRLVDRNGIASEFTQWVTATVDANPDKLIDIISGHISESTLDQILRGKIDSASGLANDAQNLANQVKVAADNAVTTAQNAVTTAQNAADAAAQEASDRAAAMVDQANTLMADSAAKVKALKDEVDPKITSLQNGITQVTTDYKAGDVAVVGQLNAYKTSNDSAVASVLQKAESAVATGSTNSSAITAINGQISTLEGSISTKADASALSSLTTRVTNAEGVNTSQGTAITNLQNTVNHATTGLATKASTSALTAVDNKVTAANGRIDTTNSNLTTLTGRVDTVEGAVATKAEAAALTALTTRVTNTENTNTSQGTAITNLQNTVNHATTGLATKASAAALTATNSEVSRIDGIVTSQASSISKLQSDLSTTDTKANTAINNAATAQQTANTAVTAGQVNATNLSKLESSISVTSENLTANGSQATLNIVEVPVANAFLVANPDSMTGSVIKLKGQVHAGLTNSKMLVDPNKLYKLRMRFRRTSGDANRIYVAVVNHNATGDRTVTAANVLKPVGTLINSANYPISNELPALNSWREVTYYFKGKSSGASTGTGTLTNPRTFPALAATVDIGVLANYNMGNNLAQEYEIDYLIFEDATNEAANDANSTALQVVDTRVTNVDGKVTANSNSITSLNSRMSAAEGNINKKADASALNTLDTKVTNVDGRVTANTNALQQLNSTVAGKADASVLNNYYTKTDANSAIAGQISTFESTKMTPAIKGLDSLSIPDTRSANQPPSWYWTNYPKRVVNEFKSGSAIGSPGGITGYGSLQTVVPLNDASGGAIRQTFESGDGLNIATRYSTSTTAWSAWSTHLKNVNTKITEQTTTIDGIKGIKTVTIDNNGVMSGYGLVSELVNGQVTSSFGINADTFFIGSPSNNKKPFVQKTTPSIINGVTVPAGTYIDTAYIGNSTIGTAHINDLAVTTAKIGNGQITTAKIGNAAITTAKIGDLQVDTLKIKDDAVSIGIGAQGVHTLNTVSNGGKIRLDIGMQTYYSAWDNDKIYLRVLRNGTVIRVFQFTGVEIRGGSEGWSPFAFAIVCALPPIIETIPAGTTVTYSIQIGLNGTSYGTPDNTNQSWIRLSNLSMSITELKK